MVGDKPCLEYSQLNLAKFRNALWAMPKTVRVKSIWHLPYDEAVRAFPKLTDASKRANKTLNADLSYLSTFAKEMVAVGHWPENFINSLGLAATVTRQQKSTGRIPWKPVHLETMFRSPIYVGNAGSQRRLNEGGVGSWSKAPVRLRESGLGKLPFVEPRKSGSYTPLRQPSSDLGSLAGPGSARWRWDSQCWFAGMISSGR